VKEAQKEKRQNKMPKHVKKRKEKLAKQGKKK
jgi:RIO kinase 1